MWFLLIATILLSVAWRLVASEKMRSMLMPWALAVIILNVSCSQFYMGVLHAMLALTNYGAWIICLDGLEMGKRRSRNACWCAFIVFWGYMILSSFWGHYAFKGMAAVLHAYLTTFCVGYYLSCWACRTNGSLRRINLTIALSSIVIGYLYLRHGAFMALEDGVQARAGFDLETLDQDVKTNVNYTALCMCTILPFLLVSVMTAAHSRSQIIIKFISVIGFLLCCMVLIRTGARNGGLAVFPLVLYFLFSTTNRAKKRKRRWLFVAVGILSVAAVAYTMRGATEIRAFNLRTNASSGYVDDLNEISSGRVGWWIREYKAMKPLQRLIGRGFEKTALNERGRVSLGNYHSIFVLVFFHAGLIGLFLFLTFILSFYAIAMRKGDRGRMAMMFFSVWLLTGVGEAWGATGGATAVLAGFAVALCGNGAVLNVELLNDSERTLHIARYGWRRG